MIKFRSKVTFALATLILAVLVCLGILIGQLFKGFYITTFEERIEKESGLIIKMIDSSVTSDSSIADLMSDVSDQLDIEITVLRSDGEIIANTNVEEITENRLENISKLQRYISAKNTDFEPFYVMNDEEELFYSIVPINQGVIDGYLILSVSVELLKATNQKIWWLLIISLGLAFVIILMLGIRITRQYAKPIEDATRVANELAKGNYRARTYEDRADEMGMLSQSINILARNLQQMTKAQEMQNDRLGTLIENMGSGLILIDSKGYIILVNKFFKRIFHVKSKDFLYKLYHEALVHNEVIQVVEEVFMTESQVRKQLHLPLKIERRHFEVYGAPIIGENEEWKGIVLVFHDITELKRLEEMRKDFVANVSHELKTPMTSIRGFSETLLDGAAENEELRTYFLNIILKESDRLQNIIKDLLDLSRIEQEGFLLNLQHVDLVELLADIEVILQHKAEQRGIKLNLDLPNTTYIIDGDAHRLKQIFINLINNALSYTQEGGEVNVTIEKKKKVYTVSVSDTGIGMSKEQIPRIFERFYRIDKARSRNSGGTGLGLAIVKHLVEAHKGKIKVESELNKGTVFTVILKRTT
ncbi:two-component system histidine kinase PnpS [Bacillus solimangrovi]|uniref:histidine kinase n=1 Tax=Bacillus solimangrovi TaxID=1305675 RepID=A0A1E5LCQ1_9BACI|nr:ATP-binding protein [Bacillus solimangrovi]OEH91862.1 PAS domain-containing sensor histidine kinase [Bacillus solimangrovi]